jgi:hypothetical protein
LIAFLKTLQKFKIGMAGKFSLGTRQTDGINLVWFGEIERKLTKLSMTTFTYRSSSYSFYGTNTHTNTRSIPDTKKRNKLEEKLRTELHVY